jgi:hypothetical protein
MARKTTKLSEKQNKLVDFIKKQGPVKLRILLTSGLGSRRTVYHNLNRLEELAYILWDRKNREVSWAGDQKDIENTIRAFREEKFFLRDPTIEEIAMQTELPFDEVEANILNKGIGKKLNYTSPSQEDIKNADFFLMFSKNTVDTMRLYFKRNEPLPQGNKGFFTKMRNALKEPNYNLEEITNFIVWRCVNSITSKEKIDWLKIRHFKVYNEFNKDNLYLRIIWPLWIELNMLGVFVPKDQLEAVKIINELYDSFAFGLGSARASIDNKNPVYVDPKKLKKQLK